MRKRVYIAGKITGLKIHEAMKTFNKVEQEINNKSGYRAVNPCRLLTEEFGTNRDWSFYMGESVKLLLECDHITFLSNSSDSKGARLEREIARFQGIEEITGFLE